MFSMLLCSKWHYYEAISHSIRVLKDCSVYHCDCRVCLEMQFSQWIAINLFRSDIVIILPFPSTALPKDRIAQAVLVITDQFRTGELCRGQGCYIEWVDHAAFCQALCNTLHFQPPSPSPLYCRQSSYGQPACHLSLYHLIKSFRASFPSHVPSFEAPCLSFFPSCEYIYNALTSSLFSAMQTTPEMWKCYTFLEGGMRN